MDNANRPIPQEIAGVARLATGWNKVADCYTGTEPLTEQTAISLPADVANSTEVQALFNVDYVTLQENPDATFTAYLKCQSAAVDPEQQAVAQLAAKDKPYAAN